MKTDTSLLDEVLAVDIGGTKIAAGVVRQGLVVAQARCPTPATGARDVVAAAVRLASQVRANYEVAAVGIASAGVINERGVVVSATAAISGWTGTDLVRGLGDPLGLPAVALNDVHAHALGEFEFGAGRASQSLLLVAIGTGIGGGLILDGQLVVGRHQAAAHVGHVDAVEAVGLPCPCGQVGHLEGIGSGTGIEAAYRKAAGAGLSARDIAARAAEPDGDSLARAVLVVAGRATGRAVGGLLNVLDPDLVIVSGGVSQAGGRWWESLRAGVAGSALAATASTPVVLAECGQEGALLGAAEHARRMLQAAFSQPPPA